MKELEEKEKLLDYRTAYKNVSNPYNQQPSTNQPNQYKYQPKNPKTIISPNKDTLKTIPEGDNENHSKKYTEEGDKDRSNITNQNNLYNSSYSNSKYSNYQSKNYSSSPQHYENNSNKYQQDSNVNISRDKLNPLNNSKNRQDTDLVYSSDEHEENSNFEQIKKKYAHINKESN